MKKDCKIHQPTWIGNEVEIGEGTRIQAFAFIPNGVTIEEDVFIGPHVCFTNDPNLVCKGKDYWKKTLVKKIDEAFSEFIRRRDTKDGWGKCCSCGAIKAYEQLDAGHFINRKWLATRWHEDNVHAQCISCNRFGEGDSAGFALFMLDKYGREHVEYLQALSRTRAGFSDFGGELMLKEYKQKLKELDTNK